MTNEKVPKKVLAAVVATGLMSFSGVIVETAINIAFPTLMQEFKVNTSTVQWMTSSYLLIIAVIVPFSASLKRSFSTRRLFLTAISCFIIGVVLDALAPNFSLLLLGRMIQGIGTGIALPLMFNIIMEQVPKSKVGTMMGIANLITGVAPAIGPTFGGLIISYLNWRWIFYILLPILVGSLLLGLWGITQAGQLQAFELDPLSAISLALTFMALIWGFSNLASGKLFSLNVLGSILFGLLSGTIFVKRSLQMEAPLINVRLFKNKSFSALCLAFFGIQMTSLSLGFLLPNYAQLVNGTSALTAGLLVLPAGVLGSIMAPLGGNLYDRYGARIPIMVGISSMVLGVVLFNILIADLENWELLVIYLFYMGGMGLDLANLMANAQALLPQAQSAQGNAILNTIQQFAGSVGTSTASAIVGLSQQQFGNKGAHSTTIGSQHAFYLLLVVMLIVWGLLAKFAGRTRKNNEAI